MRRTLFVGDVHSCADELLDLVDRAALVSGDRVFFTGDLLSRGPKPHEVLKRLAESGEADVIVMGALARGRLKDWILGSTAERVLHGGRVDVLAVKPVHTRRWTSRRD